jgi:hypothetical protein
MPNCSRRARFSRATCSCPPNIKEIVRRTITIVFNIQAESVSASLMKINRLRDRWILARHTFKSCEFVENSGNHNRATAVKGGRDHVNTWSARPWSVAAVPMVRIGIESGFAAFNHRIRGEAVICEHDYGVLTQDIAEEGSPIRILVGGKYESDRARQSKARPPEISY